MSAGSYSLITVLPFPLKRFTDLYRGLIYVLWVKISLFKLTFSPNDKSSTEYEPPGTELPANALPNREA